MPVSAKIIRRIGALGLSSEQMAGVLDIVADLMEADETRRAAQTERKRRSRQMSRDGHASVTGQSRDPLPPSPPKRKGPPDPLKENNPPLPPNPSTPVTTSVVTPPPSKRNNGTRLPKDWQLPRAWGNWAIEAFPFLSPEQIRQEGEKFRDFWVAKTGANATKLDWEATWRNWIRRAAPDLKAKPQKVTMRELNEAVLKRELAREAEQAAAIAEQRRLFEQDGLTPVEREAFAILERRKNGEPDPEQDDLGGGDGEPDEAFDRWVSRGRG